MTRDTKTRQGLPPSPTESASPSESPRWATLLRAGLLPGGVALAVLVAYLLNGSALPGNDTQPARYAAVSLVKRGDVDLDEFGRAFSYRGGVLPYYVQRTHNGHIISRFGLGVPLAAAPVFAVGLALHGGRLTSEKARSLAKLVSALYVALSVALVILAARQLGAPDWVAATVAVSYGLGTVAFSVVSQALWQHGPAMFCLALGLYLLLRAGRVSVWTAGGAFAAMVLCRPPTAVFALLATVYVAHAQRKHLLGFVLVALPFALLQAGYNHYYAGSVLRFSQMLQVSGPDALPQESYWHSSMAVGLAGLLASPSRGLFVYSPLFLLLLWAPVKAWRETSLLLRYQLAAVGLLVLVLSSYYGWYGGWTYGYRMLADATPVLSLLLIPALRRLPRARVAVAIFAVLLVTSITIHTVGAYCYDPYAWDAKPDVDHHLDRLWSVREGQLVYWFTHLRWRP